MYNNMLLKYTHNMYTNVCRGRDGEREGGKECVCPHPYLHSPRRTPIRGQPLVVAKVTVNSDQLSAAGEV